MARTAALASYPSPKVLLLTSAFEELSAVSGCILLPLTSLFFMVLLVRSVLCVSSNLFSFAATVTESSCQSRGRGVPGRQHHQHHHHSTPLINRAQKITPAFQPQQQPLGFGQVSMMSHAHKYELFLFFFFLISHFIKGVGSRWTVGMF